MKKTTRFMSLLLAFVIIVGSVPALAVTAFAEETETLLNELETALDGQQKEEIEEQVGLIESIYKEMDARKAITKDRSAIKPESEAAVYVNGELKHEGSFRDMWKKAMDLAPMTAKDVLVPGNYYETVPFPESEIEAADEVEFVLNKDIHFDYKYEFSDYYYHWGGLYIWARKLTIDLNGHLLRRTDFDSELYSGSVLHIYAYSRVTIMDSSPTTVHKGRIDDHVWKYDKNGTVELKGGIITGGQWRTSDGGGIYMDHGARVTMLGGTIAGNRATYGGAVALGDNCTLDMRKGTSRICYNNTKGNYNDGGAICFYGEGSKVLGGYVYNNVADDYGAGVYFFHESNKCTLDGTVVFSNRAMEEGGGVYAMCPYNSGSLITNCRIIGNYSGERGGGIYVDTHLLTISNTTVEGNCSKEHGGGICLSSSKGRDTYLDGKMIVRNNYKSSYSNKENASDKSNLYIQGNEDLILLDIAHGSEVWVRTGTSATKHNGIDKPITEGKTLSSVSYFYSDNTKYYVEHQLDPSKKNHLRFYLVEGKRPENHDVQTLESYAPVTDDDGYVLGCFKEKPETETEVETGAETKQEVTFPLVRGYVEYNMMSTSFYSAASPFYYSDGYFFEDPDDYNPHLATMSINMAVAAFGRNTNAIPGNKYANHFANVKQLMSDIGCAEEAFFVNEDYQKQPEYFGEKDRLSTIAVAISQKKVEFEGQTYTIVPVAIRGGGYEVEWASNVTLGHYGEAKGFADAADQVYGHVQSYIHNYGLEDGVAEGTVKFWVVGYSRAGATANLTSKRLVDSYGKAGNQVFGYTFEAPMGGVDSAKDKLSEHTDYGAYKTIHNTVNENDFVTLVAPSEMGFLRYGVDHLIGADYRAGDGVSKNSGSKYNAQRMKMVAQLKAITPYYNFRDDWEVADVNIILSFSPIFSTDLIDKGEQSWDDPNPECRDIYTFLRWFFKRVQVDGLDTNDAISFRSLYSLGIPTASIVPIDSPQLDYLMTDLEIPEDLADRIRDVVRENPSAKEEMLESDMPVEAAVAFLMNMMYTLPDEKMEQLTEIVMDNLSAYLGKSGLMDMYKLYKMFTKWTDQKPEKRQDTLYILMEILIADSFDEISEILGADKAERLRQALASVLYFGLNYASADYAEKDDDGMWGVGTFINNMDVIVSNHYQEISVAWVRSYDSFYEKDLQAYKIEKAKTEAPTGSYESESQTLTLSADAGSSIFYSTDGGETWTLYTKPVVLDTDPGNIKTKAISRGVASEEGGVPMNRWAGSLFGDGNAWFILISCIAVALVVVVTLEVNRKGKKNPSEEQES